MRFYFSIFAFLFASLSYANCLDEPTHERGYWFYSECVDNESSDEKDDEYPKVLPALPSDEVLMLMHPQQIKELMEERLNHAIYTLKPSDVLDYKRLQTVARKKAQAFTGVSSYVSMLNPSNNAKSQYPINTTGKNIKNLTDLENRRRKILSNASDFAVIMFTQKNCQYCIAQMDTLDLFNKRYSWNIRVVDKDLNPLMASRFNVEVTPYTFIIKRGRKEWLPIAVGLETLEGIEKSVYRGIRLLNNEITPAQYFTTEQNDGGFFDPKSVNEAPKNPLLERSSK